MFVTCFFVLLCISGFCFQNWKKRKEVSHTYEYASTIGRVLYKRWFFMVKDTFEGGKERNIKSPLRGCDHPHHVTPGKLWDSADVASNFLASTTFLFSLSRCPVGLLGPEPHATYKSQSRLKHSGAKWPRCCSVYEGCHSQLTPLQKPSNPLWP